MLLIIKLYLKIKIFAFIFSEFKLLLKINSNLFKKKKIKMLLIFTKFIWEEIAII